MSELRDPRVLFAAERTLLAWNRTSLALIGFGFLVERSGLLMSVLAPERAHSLPMSINTWVGLAFILLGSACALYSSRQYRRVLATLGSEEIPRRYDTRWGVAINLAIALLGLLLAAALLLRQ